MTDSVDQRRRLEAAIEALEAKRVELGADVVAPLLSAARSRLSALSTAPAEARRTITVLFAQVSASIPRTPRTDIGF